MFLSNVQWTSHYNTRHSTYTYYTSHSYIHSHLYVTHHVHAHSHLHFFCSSWQAGCPRLLVSDILMSIEKEATPLPTYLSFYYATFMTSSNDMSPSRVKLSNSKTPVLDCSCVWAGWKGSNEPEPWKELFWCRGEWALQLNYNPPQTPFKRLSHETLAGKDNSR
jgi:hypothetical protein